MEEAMTHQEQPRGTHELAQPSFAHFDATPGSARTSAQASSTGFREWLRKITSGEQSSAKLACEHVRLEEIRKLLQSMLNAHLVGMSSRDLRLYLKVISASRLAVVREMRFECFDLLCRKISEPVAVRKLREMDVLLG
jgi:hypothetical protein